MEMFLFWFECLADWVRANAWVTFLAAAGLVATMAVTSMLIVTEVVGHRLRARAWAESVWRGR